MNNKSTSKQVAKWFIDRAALDVKNGGDYLTQLKLQKLLYYAKGFFYVFQNDSLFEERFKAQKYGPVLQSVANVVSKYKRDPIKSEFADINDIENPVITNILEFVYNNVSRVYDVSKLIDCTHKELPWRSTQEKRVIKEDLIEKYFKETYLSGNIATAALPIDNEKLFIALSKNNVLQFKEAYLELAK